MANATRPHDPNAESMRAEPLNADATSRIPGQDAWRRRGELAMALQEAFTVAVRLRTKRQPAANAEAFRAHVKQLLSAADRQARSAGYDPELVRLAIYAYVAFLDESVLNSPQSVFADWARQPLQEEVFGDHVAGENFFRHLGDLVKRNDSEDVADVLEVYQLCLLLGFHGKFAANPATLQAVSGTTQDKIRRIRGQSVLSPSWSLPPDETPARSRDVWLPRLVIAAGAALALALVCYALFRLGLGSGVGDLGELVTQLAR